MTRPHSDDRDSYLHQFRLQVDRSFGIGTDTDASSRLSHQTTWCIRVDTAGYEVNCDLEKEATEFSESSKPDAEGQSEDSAGQVAGDEQEVVLGWVGPGDPENPRNLPKWRKWLCTYVVSSACLCV